MELSTDDPFLYCRVVIAASKAVEPIPLPGGLPLIIENDSHIESRYEGSYQLAHMNLKSSEVYIPQRSKRMAYYCSHDLNLEATLASLDSKHEGARQLYKLNTIMPEIYPSDWVIVNTKKVSDAPGTFYILANEAVYAYFMVDKDSVTLMFSSLDLKDYIRSISLNRYLFYRLPVISNRPVFINTKLLCARWQDLKHDMLRGFNALESNIFKDPSIRNY